MIFRQLLSNAEKAAIDEACDMAIELSNLKQRIFEYVESRMSFIAPNLSAIISASTAAKLMGMYCTKFCFCLVNLIEKFTDMFYFPQVLLED